MRVKGCVFNDLGFNDFQSAAEIVQRPLAASRSQAVVRQSGQGLGDAKRKAGSRCPIDRSQHAECHHDGRVFLECLTGT